MNRPALRQSILPFALTTLAIIAGCDRSNASRSAQVLKSTPEVRFQNILDSFRRKIEDQPVGFVVVGDKSRSTMLGTNKVTSQLIPPENPGGNFKAVVTVTTESHYSLRRTKNAIEESEREKIAKNQGSGVLNDPADKQGTGILDPDPSGARSDSSTGSVPPGQDIVSRRPEKNDVRKYELVDDGDRWQLVTKCDPKTEQSIQFAFDAAIARQ